MNMLFRFFDVGKSLCTNKFYVITVVDRKWKATTPGGSACALRPWTERSEGSGSSHALRKACAWNVDQRFLSTTHLIL